MPRKKRFLKRKKATKKVAKQNIVKIVYTKNVDCAICAFGFHGANNCGGGYNIRRPGEGGCKDGIEKV